MSVAATDPNAIKADFSNYGKGWVDLCAPGMGIYSTFLNGQYAWWDGTSMSAPFVSGEAALILSLLQVRGGETNALTAVLGYLASGVDYIYEINSGYKKGKLLGNGNIDMYSAVLQVQGSDTLTVKKATYDTANGKLMVIAASSKAPGAVLKVEGLGNMKFGGKTYKFKASLASRPPSVDITSTGGGIVTAYVGTSKALPAIKLISVKARLARQGGRPKSTKKRAQYLSLRRKVRKEIPQSLRHSGSLPPAAS